MSAQPQVHSFNRPELGELVTPEYAQELLKRNTSNRPLSAYTVEQYAAAMERGEWKFNGDTIRISESNVMLDGQHRCHAIVKSGIPQRYIIVRGLPDEVFQTIDQGKKRTVGNMLAIAGEINHSTLASALRWILIISERVGSTKRSVTPAECFQALTKHQSVRRWVAYHQNSKDLRALFDSNVVAVATLAAEKYGDEVVERFLWQLASGEGLKRTDPAYELRARAIQNKTRTTRTPDYLFVPLIIKAMKAFVNGKQIGVLRLRDDEEYPTI